MLCQEPLPPGFSVTSDAAACSAFTRVVAWVVVELERIVIYLDAVTLQALTVDLITIRVYEVNVTEVAMPQRISPDPSAIPSFTMAPAARRGPKGVLSDGPDAFVDSIADIEGQ